ncbi:MAG: TIGR00266 family protein [Pseudomonadota bacterium]
MTKPFGRRVSTFTAASAVPEIPIVRHEREPSLSDDIEFEIKGSEMQFVEIELDPGESAVAEAGAMMFKPSSVSMETVFGDGSHAQENAGLFDKMVGAGKRLITGESLFTTVFTHDGHGKARVAFASPYPGHIIPLRLDEHDNKIVCQKDAFLCAAKGVSIGVEFQRNIMTGLFGGEGFIMQKLEGDGWVFVHAGGTVIEKTLDHGDVLDVDTGCIVALSQSIQYDIVRAGSVKSMVFGGEGFFFAQLRGPGKVWLQSLPFGRLAGRVAATLQPGSLQTGGESSVFSLVSNLSR